MKCAICGREFDPITENGPIVNAVCAECEGAKEELSNGEEE